MADAASHAGFERLFGRRAEACASAPGRVNLIGEHTDYNGGFVLPTATPQRTEVALARRSDGIVRAWSANVEDGERWIEYKLGGEHRGGGWRDYVAGVTAALREQGIAIDGFDARIESDLPLGGGLASSASLEVALLRAIDGALGLGLEPVAIAKLAHRAETGLAGVPVGIMDQMAASLCEAGHGLFLDTETLACERLPLPPRTTLIVVDSGIRHRHAAGEYRVRRAECEEAARRLGARMLRNVSLDDLARVVLPAPLERRVRHVVTENARVLGARDALRRGDAATLGRLMDVSHRSMRDDFEVSTPEIDALVERMRAAPGVFGARLTGGGFGGSVVALASAEAPPRSF